MGTSTERSFGAENSRTTSLANAGSGTIDIGGDLTVRRLGFGAMRITGPGIWGEPRDRDEAKAVLRRAIELGVNFIDTADSYGPHVSEELIAEALHPYPEDLVIASGRLERTGSNRWPERPPRPRGGLRRYFRRLRPTRSRCTSRTGPIRTCRTRTRRRVEL
jgi:aryl-alcohol dehydrogenase-like predicted oxidoreductase